MVPIQSLAHHHWNLVLRCPRPTNIQPRGLHHPPDENWRRSLRTPLVFGAPAKLSLICNSSRQRYENPKFWWSAIWKSACTKILLQIGSCLHRTPPSPLQAGLTHPRSANFQPESSCFSWTFSGFVLHPRSLKRSMHLQRPLFVLSIAPTVSRIH